MTKLQFEVELVADEDPKNNTMIIKSVTEENGGKYHIPTCFQAAKHHIPLTKLAEFAKIKKTLQKRGQFRNVWVSVPDEVLKLYKDDTGNMAMDDYLLQDITQLENQPTRDKKLTEVMEGLSVTGINNNNRNNDLSKITERFVLKKFDNKVSNAKQWLQSFESECDRFGLEINTEKISALKLFLNDVERNWYESMLIKHSLDSQWKTWRDNFLDAFADKSWSSVIYALTYKHLNGSLLEYSLKKERLLLEYNSDMDNRTLTDLIVVGLPGFITNKLDRQEMTNPTTLFNNLRMYENQITKEKNNPTKNSPIKSQVELKRKTQCQICSKMGKKNRFHPEDLCWFKEEGEKHCRNVTLEIDEFQNTKN